MISPCKDCDTRTSECHAKCEAYAEYAKACEKVRKERHKDSLERSQNIHQSLEQQKNIIKIKRRRAGY